MRPILVQFVRRFWILCCLCFLMTKTIVAQYTPSLLTSGPPTVILNVETSRNFNGIMAGVGTLNLWCQALDPQTRRPVPLKIARFRHGNQRFDGTISADTYNASFVQKNLLAYESGGTWKCDLHSAYGNATGKINVNVRPVIHTNASLRVDEKDGSKSRFDVTGLTIVRGEKAIIKCPVYGQPKLDIMWQFGGKIIGSGETYTIDSVNDENDGTYICSASNQITVNGNRQRFEIFVERRLRVKSEYAWLLPLSIILLIILLLAATIIFCECKKRQTEQKPILDED